MAMMEKVKRRLLAMVVYLMTPPFALFVGAAFGLAVAVVVIGMCLETAYTIWTAKWPSTP